jgi:hypothetical protein
MKIELENITSYTVPAGKYHVVFSRIAEKVDPSTGQTTLRITWDVLWPNKNYYQYKLAKNYPFEEGSSTELIADLVKIFGDDLACLKDENGKLDTDKLIDQAADAVVETIKNAKYTNPLSVVSRLLPSGTFEFTEKAL